MAKAPRIVIHELSVVGRRLYDGTGEALADFSSHTAACQVAHYLNNPDWAPPCGGKWFTTPDDVLRARAVREMIDGRN